VGLRWRSTGPADAKILGGRDLEGPAGHQTCPTLARALEAVFQKDRPEILHLGSLCGQTVVYLAERGARVAVEGFDPPEPHAEAEQGQDGAEQSQVAPLRINQPDETFDLVLVWELLDFVPADRLAEVTSELRRVLVEGGRLLLFSMGGSRIPDQPQLRPGRYRILADDKVSRESIDEPTGTRYEYATRAIERALEPLSIQTVHLQRNQLREFLAVKRVSKSRAR
jgi:SAM-dependent methyltransferase